jgi:putative addiction module component (TIGR02574 family)
MTEQSKRVLEQALVLPAIERAALIEELFSSFDFPARQEIDKLWAHEAEDRIDAYERGELKASAAALVFDRLNQE